jgi:hypothetical protein
MGLCLEVGILADLRDNDEEGYHYFRGQFRGLNGDLQRSKLPQHLEPEDCEVWSCEMFGYSGLHYLRRIAAHLDTGGQLPPPGGDEASKDPVLARYHQHANGMKAWFTSGGSKKEDFQRRFDHLILHSDAEGFYLPIDFPSVVYPDPELGIAGGIVGSSHSLLRECQRIAEALQIPSHLDESSEALWEAADSQGEGSETWERYGIESFSCVCLMRGCLKSIERKAALVFV